MNKVDLLAVSPTAATEFIDTYDMFSHFGFEFGRQLVAYPRRWDKLVLAKIQKQSSANWQMEQKRFAESLEHMQKKGGIRNFHWDEFVEHKDWLENALEQNETRPVSAIVDVDDKSSVVHSPKSAFKKYLVKTERDFDIDGRDASNLVAPLHMLLDECSEIWLVDPYFLPCDSVKQSGKREVLKALLSYPARKCRKYNCVVQNATFLDEIGTDRNAISAFLKSIKPLVRTGQTVEFIRSKTKLHARYALSRIGGIRYDRGFQTYAGSVDLSYLDAKKCRLELERCTQPNVSGYYERAPKVRDVELVIK